MHPKLSSIFIPAVLAAVVLGAQPNRISVYTFSRDSEKHFHDERLDRFRRELGEYAASVMELAYSRESAHVTVLYLGHGRLSVELDEAGRAARHLWTPDEDSQKMWAVLRIGTFSKELLRECLDHPISQLDNESVPTGACFSSEKKGSHFKVSSLRCAKGPLNQSQVLVAIVDGLFRVLPAAVRGRWGAKLRASSGGQFGRPPANGRSAERISADAAVDRPALLLRLWWRGGRRGMAIKGGPPHINNGF